MASTSSSSSPPAGPSAGDEDLTGYDYVMVDEDVEEEPSCMTGREEEERGGGGGDEAWYTALPPCPAAPLAARKAPGSLPRFFVLPEDHELAFDFFSGIPTLHARPRSSSVHRRRRRLLLPRQPPPLAVGLPSRVDFRPFVTGPCKDFEVVELLFWASPSPSPEEEREGLVVIPAFRPPPTFVSGCEWRARRALAEVRVLAALCSGGGAGPLFFTFSPDVLVLYGRRREKVGGNNFKEISIVMVAGEDYHELVWRSQEFWRPVDSRRRRTVVGALTAGAVIF